MISTKDLDALIDRFIQRDRPNIITDLTNYNDIRSAANAVGKNGKKHPHQYRISLSVLDSFSKQIMQFSDAFKKAKSFDDIYSLVMSCKIYKIGPLAIYDTAVRIGRLYNIEPQEIYLQQGAKLGAQALGINKKRALKQEFVAINKNFSKLKAHEIECFLCIYKKALRKINSY